MAPKRKVIQDNVENVKNESVVKTETKTETNTEPEKTKKSVSPSSVPLPFVKKVKDYMKEYNLNEQSTKTLSDIKHICQTFIDVVMNMTKEGNTVSFPNHMTFKRTLRRERTHHNPKTREEIVKSPHYVLTMEVKPNLKERFSKVDVVKSEPKTKKVATKKMEKNEKNDNQNTEQNV